MNILSAGKLAFKGASTAGLLPAFGWSLLLVAALAATGAGWAVHRWDRGAQALAENAQLKARQRADAAAYEQLLATARDLQQSAVDSALALQQAGERMDAIATTLESTLDHNHEFAAQQRDALADLLAARPDLRDQRLGDDILRHWNASNAGAAAGAAAKPAAGPAGKPAQAVPAATGGAQRSHSRPAGQPRPGGGAVSRLQRAQRQPAVGARGVAGHRVAVVLRRSRPVRPGRLGVPA